MLVLALPALSQSERVHETCRPCHSEQVEDFMTHPHEAKVLSCDACHGASLKHRMASGAAPPDRVAAPDEVPALCGGCHPGPRRNFEAGAHGKLLLSDAKVRVPNCGTCHGVHAQTSARQMLQRCERCHTSIPEVCKKTSAQPAAVRCMSCHDRHTLAPKKPEQAQGTLAAPPVSKFSGKIQLSKERG
jgi:hypothetical protein